MSSIKRKFECIRNRFKEERFDNIIWLISVVPNWAGFSLRNDKIAPYYWVLHLSLLFYVYGMGSAAYQIKFAQGAEDFIKSYVNVSLFILIGNISFWWIRKRPILREALIKMEKSDQFARNSVFTEKYNRRLFIIKVIVIGFYMSQFIDAAFIYLPHRVDVENDYSMVPCVGLEPLTTTPNREICLTILFVQEITIMIACLNYQALLLCLIAHTSAMYHMLSYEMLALNENGSLEETQKRAKETLPSLIRRHNLILDVFDKLKDLYSFPIGVDFGSNAVCMSLFFYLSFNEWLKFIPVLVYCFLVFFLYCFLCQKLTNASEAFEQAVYCCGWENFDVKEKKIIYVMLRQSQKPVILLAADIIPVNIYTFATTLQAMFKFVTVVKF